MSINDYSQHMSVSTTHCLECKALGLLRDKSISVKDRKKWLICIKFSVKSPVFFFSRAEVQIFPMWLRKKKKKEN